MSLKQNDKIIIHILISQKVEIFRVSYLSNCISNILLLLSRKETGISYHDKNDYIILKKGDKKVIWAKQCWHLFILKFIIVFQLVMLANACEK